MPATEQKVFADREEANRAAQRDVAELLAVIRTTTGQLPEHQIMVDMLIQFSRIYRNAVAGEPIEKTLKRAGLTPDGREIEH